MSTFGGWMPEFPDIRVDYFRHVKGIRPPLACFLSHVHSDHLAGLESLKSPFIYCSAATKELLLRLERYPHRINFELGIFESKRQQYKHLKTLLKPIPLDTPTCIELAPGSDVQVTLFDANHCPGAVMFLIEGNGQAILYTGDTRSEPWFLNALRRNPVLIEYTSGLKTLDCIYLDTSFTDNIPFPTKAEGLQELLQKVSKYPSGTVFHFEAWTFGYEDVWIALSRLLKSRIHVDSYKMRLYQSLFSKFSGNNRVSRPFSAQEYPILTGFTVGNTEQRGILTLDEKVTLHSCEKGMNCGYLNRRAVRIRPIIARMPSGQEITEIGVGGGERNLLRKPEFDLHSDVIVQNPFEAVVRGESPIMSEIQSMLTGGFQSSQKALFLDGVDLDLEQKKLSLNGLAKLLTQSAATKHATCAGNSENAEELDRPTIITFPYSRHSSYAELRDLVKAFKPKDVYPCTVDKTKWHEGVSVRSLFGDLCSETLFRHDSQMRDLGRTLTEPHQDEAQNSWTTYNIKTSQETDSSRELDEEKQENGLDEDEIKFVQKSRKNADHSESSPNSTKSDRTRSSSIDSLEILSEPDPRLRRRKANFETRDYEDQKRMRLQKGAGEVDCDNSSENTPGTKYTTEKEVVGTPSLSYYDSDHQVHRCVTRGWEMLTRSGHCTSCGMGEPSYYEIFDSDLETTRLGQHDSSPGIAPSIGCDEDEVQPILPSDLTGCYLNDASTYDSPYEPDGKEYKVNSFIDSVSTDTEGYKDSPSSNDLENSSIHTQIQENVSSAVIQELNNTRLYKRGSRPYSQLSDEDDGLVNDYLSFKKQGFLSPIDNGESAEIQSALINVEVQDPLISEVILSQIQGDSQASAISPERLRRRVDAFLAIVQDEDGAKNSISLISAGENHTEADIEL